MADLNERDTKLVQFLNEAHAKEKELEVALQLHIGMTTKAPYKKRLQQHLRETKNHAKQLERRVKKLGGGSSLVQSAQQAATTTAGRARAAVKGQVDAVRGVAPVGGPSEAEQMLKNARQQYAEEGQEIATYLTLEAFAEKVGDKETAQLAKSILREEIRMAKYLEKQIAQLTNGVATSTVPASQRSTGRRRTRRRSASSRSSSSRSTGSSRSRSSSKPRSSSKSRSSASSSRSRGSSSRSSGSRSSSSRSRGGSRSSGSRRRRSS
jgi:ferritin-like metal-binding protein YciE